MELLEVPDMQKRQVALLSRFPEEVKTQMSEYGFIDFDTYSRFRNLKSRKIFCKFNCSSCSEEEILSTKAIGKRIFVKEAICRKCVSKYMATHPDWIQKNSEAQKKIQSTPEQKLKNSIGVSNFWKNNPDVKERVAKKIAKRYQEDAEYRRKVNDGSRNNTFSLKGEYLFRDSFWIKYESSYELCFLIWAEKNKDISKIRRCNFSIEYTFDNSKFNYFPDYVIFIDELKYLVEIKSIKNFHYTKRKEKELEKINTAKKFVKENNFKEYLFISEEHALANEISFRRSSGIRPLCKLLNSVGKLKINSEKHRLKYLGVIKNEDPEKDIKKI